MGVRGRAAASLWVLAGLVSVSAAVGDEQCDRGVRDVTPAERDALVAVLEVAKSVIPPAPEGWEMSDQEVASAVPSRICRDGEDQPWNYSLSRSYRQRAGAEARNDAINAAVADAAADMKAKQPRLDAAMAKMLKMNQDMMAAVQAGNQARAEAIGKEIEAAQQEYERILNEGGSAERLDASTEAAMEDLEMSVAIAINPPVVSEGPEATPLRVSGAQRAFKSTLENGQDSQATVLLGQWRSADGRLHTVRRAGANPTAAHTIVVRVHADSDRLQSVVDAIDFGALSPLLGR